MAITPEQVQQASERWGLEAMAAPVADRLAAYGNLLVQWNARLSLTAIRDEAELVERHLMEGVFAAAHHPKSLHRARFRLRNRYPRHPHRALQAFRLCDSCRIAAEKGCFPAGAL